jgi:hypothetical protein
MGFWSGFAKGWEAESERIERRKLFQQELKDKRAGTLAELVTRMGRSGATSAGAGQDATPNLNPKHLEETLITYGMKPEQIATLNAKGGAYALGAAVDTIKEYNTAENPFTPAHFERLTDSIVVTQNEGTPLDPKALSEQLFGPDYWATLEPDQQMIIELNAQQGAPAPSVTSTFIPDEPFRQETANQIVDAATETLMVDLVNKEEELQAQFANMPEGDEKAILAQELSQVAAAKTALENGNIAPGIAMVGSEVIGPYLENYPRLKENTGLLGPWKGAADAYLGGGQDQTQEALTPAKQYSNPEQVQADIDAGLLQEGDIVIINGQEVPIQFGD